jgi:hypothetical protein
MVNFVFDQSAHLFTFWRSTNQSEHVNLYYFRISNVFNVKAWTWFFNFGRGGARVL